jgi:hypothetical protein
MAHPKQIQGSIASSDSSYSILISSQSLEQQSDFEDNTTTTNGVFSTIRIDSHEQDGFAVEELNH